MRDARLDTLADVLVRYSTRVKRGDLVAIQGEAAAMPLIEAVAEAVIKAGGNPFWQPVSERLTELVLEHGTDEQIGFLNPMALYMMRTVDVRIMLLAQQNTRCLAGMDPTKVARHMAGRRQLIATGMARTAAGELRWCGTQFPTNGAAQDAEMSLARYEDFVYRAGMLHLADPVAAWRSLHERQERAREYLQGKKEVRFRMPATDRHDGTDLRVDVSAPSRWINCSGDQNFPDGEVFAGPQGVDGHVNYTFPAVYQGQEVHGVRLAFKGGRVVDASAAKNEEFLIAMLDQDAGARTLGEIAIGTNYEIKQFSKNTLFDEKIGGTFHAAVGAGYPESGNTNESGLHWDMVCDLRGSGSSPGGTIHADGELFHSGGKFLREGWPASE